MTKEEIIEKLNKSFNGSTLNGNEYLQLLSEFLALEYPDKASSIVQLCITNPMLLGQTVNTIVTYFTGKHNIFSVKDKNGVLICYY